MRAHLDSAARRHAEAPVVDDAGMVHLSKFTAAFNWLDTVTRAVALLWPFFSSRPIPLPGWRAFNALPGAPLVLTILLLASVWLSVPRWHTRERMIRFARIAGPIGTIGVFVTGGFGLPLSWAALDVWRAIRKERGEAAPRQGRLMEAARSAASRLVASAYAWRP